MLPKTSCPVDVCMCVFAIVCRQCQSVLVPHFWKPPLFLSIRMSVTQNGTGSCVKVESHVCVCVRFQFYFRLIRATTQEHTLQGPRARNFRSERRSRTLWSGITTLIDPNPGSSLGAHKRRWVRWWVGSDELYERLDGWPANKLLLIVIEAKITGREPNGPWPVTGYPRGEEHGPWAGGGGFRWLELGQVALETRVAITFVL